MTNQTNMNALSIGFVGAGNMATAMIKGIIKNEIIPPDSVHIYDPDKNKLMSFIRQVQATPENSNQELVEKCKVIFLAVKPNVYDDVLVEIKNKLRPDHILVSIAAGISSDYVNEKIDRRCKVIRIMPNTPALVGEGMFAVSKNHELDEYEYTIINRILESVGKVEEVDEKLMNAVTAISGSSPAYVFMFIEALVDGAVLMGMKREQAYRMAAQAVLGSAKMILESGEHPGVLKDMVCSPGGTTIEAVFSLEKKGFRGAIMEAVKACALREELIAREKEHTE
jgi:pyrroline-5-carboxylate reductase